TGAIPPGWYRIGLSPAPTIGSPAGPIFPLKLARPDLSGLEREIKPGREHTFVFDVETEG
ncbi:MAG: hypothetical protein K2V38_07680, partial [Gemmataceae bacterium]|nr:hypothetical protein [Gemmataceae bacterium]